MLLMLDSADTGAWRDLLPTGLFGAVTTNPVLMQRAGRSYDRDSFATLLEAAKDLGVNELHLQAIGATSEALANYGRQLAALDPQRIVVKVPLTPAGIRAAGQLRAEGHRITLTACYAAKQMLIATALQADYIAPYYGRLLESGENADAILDAMHAMQGGSTRILVASLRSTDQVVALAARGFSSFTLAPALGEQLLRCEASLQAAEDFETAAASTLA